jgi:hypothetical protein
MEYVPAPEIEPDGGELQASVRDEVQAYLRCGILAHGFSRAQCKDGRLVCPQDGLSSRPPVTQNLTR